MKFFMPVRIYSETDCVKHHGAELAALGRRALIVTGGRSSRENGSLADVTGVLSQAGIPFAVFDRIEQNPSVETALAAAKAALEFGADFVIGVGGGSPMDAAKAAALLARHPGKGEAFLYDPEPGTDSARLPLALIPTTCGTGSEATPVSVLTRRSRQTKQSIRHKVFADLGLVDGKYLASAPARVIRSTAVDALAHLWESRVNAHADDFSIMCAREGMRLWARSRELLTGTGEISSEDRQNLMNASTMSGMAIAQTGTSLPHGLSYPVTVRLGIPHGIACGVFEAGYLAAASKEEREECLHLAGFADLAEWKAYFAVLSDHLILPQDQVLAAADLLARNTAKLANAPFPCGPETVRKIALGGE